MHSVTDIAKENLLNTFNKMLTQKIDSIPQIVTGGRIQIIENGYNTITVKVNLFSIRDD